MERWLPVKGFAQYYSVSNLGRVLSRSRTIWKMNSGLMRCHSYKERILKPGIADDGYHFVVLCVNNEKTAVKVHVLVARHFIPNPSPDVLVEVDHIFRDKNDNRAKSLRWITRGGNRRNTVSRPTWNPNVRLRGIFRNSKNSWSARYGRKPIGSFKTKAKAIAARDAFITQVKIIEARY